MRDSVLLSDCAVVGLKAGVLDDIGVPDGVVGVASGTETDADGCVVLDGAVVVVVSSGTEV